MLWANLTRSPAVSLLKCEVMKAICAVTAIYVRMCFADCARNKPLGLEGVAGPT
jgi:hypothetical protein